MFGYNFTLDTKDAQISTDCDNKDVINNEFDEKEILDFINSEGKYRLFDELSRKNNNSSTLDNSSIIN
jgi:hypothetical protein